MPTVVQTIASHLLAPFASYHLVMCGDPRCTEMQLGHKSENLLYKHDRDRVTEEDAEIYWGIEPKVS